MATDAIQHESTSAWQGVLIGIDPATKAIVEMRIIADNSDAEETIRLTINRIMPGWFVAAERRVQVDE